MPKKNNNQRKGRPGPKRKGKAKKRRPNKGRSTTALAQNTRRRYESKDSIVVTHREFLGDVTGQVAFTPTPYVVQPGLAAVFPKVHLSARGYELYRIESLVVTYDTHAPGTQAGSIMLSAEYDEGDALPSSEIEAMNTSGAQNGPVRESLDLKLDPKAGHALNPWLKVRTDSVGGELSDYDFARFFVSTSGCTGGPILVGKLSLEVRVRFMKSTIGQESKVRPSKKHSYLSIGSSVHGNGFVGTLTNYPAHVDPNVDRVLDGLGLLDRLNGGTFLLPKGVYRIKHHGNMTTTVTQAVRHATMIRKNGAEINGELYTNSTGNHDKASATGFNQDTLTSSGSTFFDGVNDVLSIGRVLWGAAGTLTDTLGKLSVELL